MGRRETGETWKENEGRRESVRGRERVRARWILRFREGIPSFLYHRKITDNFTALLERFSEVQQLLREGGGERGRYSWCWEGEGV